MPSTIFRTFVIFALSLSLIQLSSCNRNKVEACFDASQKDSKSLAITFDNCSENAISYTWKFGDGQSGTEENPVHTYADEGKYTVTLIAITDDPGSRADNLTDTFRQEITVTQPEPFVTISSNMQNEIHNRNKTIIFNINAFAKFPIKKVKGYLISNGKKVEFMDSVITENSQYLDKEYKVNGMLPLPVVGFQFNTIDQRNNIIESNIINIDAFDSLKPKGWTNMVLQRRLITLNNNGYDLRTKKPVYPSASHLMHISDQTDENAATINKELVSKRTDTRIHTFPSSINAENISLQLVEQQLDVESWTSKTASYQLGSIVLIEDDNADDPWWVIEIIGIKDGRPDVAEIKFRTLIFEY